MLDLWPNQRGWKTFCKWMEWEVHEMVWDMEPGAIVKESFDEPAGGCLRFWGVSPGSSTPTRLANTSRPKGWPMSSRRR